MSNIMIQVPAIYTFSPEGQEPVTRVINELIAPKYIVKVAPVTEEQVIVYLAHSAPPVRAALSYEDMVTTLTKARELENGTFEDPEPEPSDE